MSPSRKSHLSDTDQRIKRCDLLQLDTEGGRKDFVLSEKKAQQSLAMQTSQMSVGAVLKAVVQR